MPVKLERALKRQAADKGLKGDRKDAYIYGTLRKTGWKPSREKKMSTPSKLIQLQQISSKLDRIITFADDDKAARLRNLGLTVGGIGALGAGGLYAAGKMGSTVAPWGLGKIPGQSLGQVGSSLAGDIKNIGVGGGAAIGRGIKQGARKVFPFLHV
jgi:hypothetical protein